MEQLSFTVPEILALIGVVQCIYILVYIIFRAKTIRGTLIPGVYFIVLGTALFMDFAYTSISSFSPYYDLIRWSVWNFVIPISALLVVQIAKIASFPSVYRILIVLSLTPLAFLTAANISVYGDHCSVNALHLCKTLTEWLNITGPISGGLALLSIWISKDLFKDLRQQKAGRERYWLILSLLAVNILFLGASLVKFGGDDWQSSVLIMRAAFGLTFLYLVTTSLFRIYPYALIPEAEKRKVDLNEQDLEIAKKIEDLMMLEKVYQEASYSRSDLARELSIPESTVSRVINQHFKKSFPQLLNEYRVEDAKRLLLETDAPMRIVYSEVGFNSLPSFNRVFKTIEKQSPGEYRKNMIK